MNRNPFSTYKCFDLESLSFKGGSFISIGSPIGEGKSTLINSMILNYLEKEIDVLVFSENPKIRTYLSDTINYQKRLNTNTGTMYYVQMAFSKPVEHFIANFKHFLIHRPDRYKRFVIIFDGPMFETEQTAFNFFNIDSNTRRVLIEKYTEKNRKELVYNIVDAPKHIKMRILIYSLKNFAAHFNSHVVLTIQFNKTGIGDTILPSNTDMLYLGDMVFTVRKKTQHNFEFSCIKNRYDVDNIKSECQLNPGNLSLELAETKNNLHF